MRGELMSEILSPGEWLRRRRKALDLTQDELAARVGCSKELIAKIEQDAHPPTCRLQGPNNHCSCVRYMLN
jgi:predicted transcriptional regulator